MEERAKHTGAATSAASRPAARGRRVPGYFTVYLLNELLTTLGLRQKP